MDFPCHTSHPNGLHPLLTLGLTEFHGKLPPDLPIKFAGGLPQGGPSNRESFYLCTFEMFLAFKIEFKYEMREQLQSGLF